MNPVKLTALCLETSNQRTAEDKLILDKKTLEQVELHSYSCRRLRTAMVALVHLGVDRVPDANW